MTEEATSEGRRRRGRPPKDEAPDTRGRILEAALELFAAEGYAGASIRKIARRVDITEAAIYAHFSGKRAIYEALVSEAGPPVVAEALALEDPAEGADPGEFVRRLVRRVVDAWDEPRSRLFASVFMRESGAGSAVGGTSLLGAIEEAKGSVAEVFNEWVEEGVLRDDFTPEHLAWELLAPIAYVRLLYLHGGATEEERREGRRLAERHADYFLSHALAQRARREPAGEKDP